VTLKLALSVDGRIATATGESQWITGPDARRMVHAMRARHDAVMVGAGTARADDPVLTVRGLGVTRQPVRVVVSRRLDLPPDSAMIRSVAEAPVWLCHDAALKDRLVQPWRDRGAACLPCAVQGSQVDPASVLALLAAKGLTRVFCEGGGGLAASLLAAGAVDELVVFGAGLVIGAEGTPAIAAIGLDRLSAGPRFDLIETRAVGGDTVQRWARRAG
jgi:diaminohydroxyphosphoribosylaminopyrimidine deaminase/5-amino-6-(5-phosphoribosylamino)uracil reductase